MRPQKPTHQMAVITHLMNQFEEQMKILRASYEEQLDFQSQQIEVYKLQLELQSLQIEQYKMILHKILPPSSEDPSTSGSLSGRR